MKNLIFATFAIVVLAMTTSCQKEEVLPQATTENPGVLAGPPSGNNGNGYESWNFCERDVFVERNMDQPDYQTLAIYDEDFNIGFFAEWISPDDSPHAVGQAVEDMFPGIAPSDHWRTAFPDEEHFIVEIKADLTEVYVLLVSIDGDVECKGFHQ